MSAAKKNTDTTAENKQPQTTEAASTPADWAQAVLNQLVESQKTWFEITSKQNELLLETVNKVMEYRSNAPTDALSEWAKQGVQGFIEAQKRWAEIAVQQSEQIMQAVQSNTNLAKSHLENAQTDAPQGIASLIQMREKWLDFIAQQNTQVITAMKDTLKLDESSPATGFADFAQQAVNNYVEVQKRWLDLALQLPFSGNANRDKK